MTDPPEEDVLISAIRRDYEGRVEEFSDVFPEYVHMDCGRDDSVWLQVFDSTRGQMGRGPRWIQVAESDDRRVVTFPDGFRPLRFREGRVWGVQTDALGIEYVAWTHVAGVG